MAPETKKKLNILKWFTVCTWVLTKTYLLSLLFSIFQFFIFFTRNLCVCVWLRQIKVFCFVRFAWFDFLYRFWSGWQKKWKNLFFSSIIIIVIICCRASIICCPAIVSSDLKFLSENSECTERNSLPLYTFVMLLLLLFAICLFVQFPFGHYKHYLTKFFHWNFHMNN